jgi:hypothetical protein
MTRSFVCSDTVYLSRRLYRQYRSTNPLTTIFLIQQHTHQNTHQNTHQITHQNTQPKALPHPIHVYKPPSSFRNHSPFELTTTSHQPSKDVASLPVALPLLRRVQRDELAHVPGGAVRPAVSAQDVAGASSCCEEVSGTSGWVGADWATDRLTVFRLFLSFFLGVLSWICSFFFDAFGVLFWTG